MNTQVIDFRPAVTQVAYGIKTKAIDFCDSAKKAREELLARIYIEKFGPLNEIVTT